MTLPALLLILGFCIGSTTAAAAPVSRDDPESADPGRAVISTAAGKAVVVTANPRASQAAMAALNAGGSAVDALVSAQAVLAVVEPQSSGLAGGGFLLHWDAEERQLEVLDGREIAPQSSRPNDLLNPPASRCPGGTPPVAWRPSACPAPWLCCGMPISSTAAWAGRATCNRPSASPAMASAPSMRLRRSIGIAQRIGVTTAPHFKRCICPAANRLRPTSCSATRPWPAP